MQLDPGFDIFHRHHRWMYLGWPHRSYVRLGGNVFQGTTPVSCLNCGYIMCLVTPETLIGDF